MARGDPAITSFNGGIFSPLMRARADYAKYSSGGDVIENFVPTVQGPMRRRVGTQFLGALPAGKTLAIFIPFEANTGAAFMLEIGDAYTRFWHAPSRALVLDNGAGVGVLPPGTGNPFTMTTPWGAGNLLDAATSAHALQTAQSNDIMWLVHGSFAPRKIKRTALYTFGLAPMGDVPNASGDPPCPFKDVVTQSISVTPSAITGVITLTASAPLFTSSWAGPEPNSNYMRIDQPAADSVIPWETGKVVALNDIRRAGGRNYKATGAGTTGTVKPTHSFGTKSDGGVSWAWQDDGYGIVAITSVISSTVANAVVTGRQLPSSVNNLATTRWARCAWNADDGFPNAIAFFRERLCFARGQTVWASVAGDFENFQTEDGGTVTPDLSLTATIAARKNDRVLWLAPGTDLIAGTPSGGFAIAEMTTAEAFGPGNARSTPIEGFGAHPVVPERIGDGYLYLQRGGRRLRELAYNPQAGTYYVSRDLTVLAENVVPRLGLAKVALQKQPDSVLWGVSATGKLLGLTYDKEQEVWAWHTHPLGGVGYGSPGNYPIVQSIGAVISPDGASDDLYLLVNRNIGGVSQRYVELIGPARDLHDASTLYYHDIASVQSANYLDCSIIAAIPKNATSVAAAHLVGATANALIEGYVANAGVVAASGLTVDKLNEPRTARVGFEYSSRWRSMPLHGSSATGAPETKKSKVQGLGVRFNDSVGFRYGANDLSDTDRAEMRIAGDMKMDEAVPLQSGDLYVLPRGEYTETPQVCIVQDQPLPLTVVGLYPRLTVEDSR